MTQRDKWKKRAVVLRYYSFKDQLRMCLNQIPNLRATLESGIVESLSWTAYFPIPPSWSSRKKVQMAGELHRAKPDRDNIDKAILDALFAEDSGVACGHIEKRWDDGRGPRIEALFSSQKNPPTKHGQQSAPPIQSSCASERLARSARAWVPRVALDAPAFAAQTGGSALPCTCPSKTPPKGARGKKPARKKSASKTTSSTKKGAPPAWSK